MKVDRIKQFSADDLLALSRGSTCPSGSSSPRRHPTSTPASTPPTPAQGPRPIVLLDAILGTPRQPRPLGRRAPRLLRQPRAHAPHQTRETQRLPSRPRRPAQPTHRHASEGALAMPSEILTTPATSSNASPTPSEPWTTRHQPAERTGRHGATLRVERHQTRPPRSQPGKGAANAWLYRGRRAIATTPSSTKVLIRSPGRNAVRGIRRDLARPTPSRLVTDLVKRRNDGDYRTPEKLTLGEYLTGRSAPAQRSQLRPFSDVALLSAHHRTPRPPHPRAGFRCLSCGPRISTPSMAGSLERAPYKRGGGFAPASVR